MTRVEIFQEQPTTPPEEKVLRLRLMKRGDVYGYCDGCLTKTTDQETLLVAVDENGKPLPLGVLASFTVHDAYTGTVAMNLWRGVDTNNVPIEVDPTGSYLLTKLI